MVDAFKVNFLHLHELNFLLLWYTHLIVHIAGLHRTISRILDKCK